MTFHPRLLDAPLRHRHYRTVVEDLRVAAHESGHAILRWANGSTISGVTIDPREIDGRTIHGRVSGESRNLEDDCDYFARLTELVSGDIGEQVFLGESEGLRGSDERKSRRIASALCDSETGIQHLIRAAQAEAKHVVLKHLHILDALVTALCERRVMGGDEVLAVINRAAGRPSTAY